MLLRSEVLLNLLAQAEHSTGRKEAAILSGPIVWPPGLGNQTALWPGCRLPLRPLLVGPGQGGKAGGCHLLMAFTLFALRSNRIFSRLRASGSRFPALGVSPGEKGSGRGEAGAAPAGTELLKTPPGMSPGGGGNKVREQTAGATEESFQC